MMHLENQQIKKDDQIIQIQTQIDQKRFCNYGKDIKQIKIMKYKQPFYKILKGKLLNIKPLLKIIQKMTEIKKLYCRFVTGMTVDLDIRAETKTVLQLKQQLCEVINLTPDRLYIGFETTLLEDNEYLGTKITDCDTVHVITSQLTEKIAYKKK
ncbi:unnamed protein product [Paramecium sonneborni]|uniref:Ubiquitin-like domain-containing protein n=1 Tax=Paramecium sonneborni TaxID=65129 RepID=A0A8S1MRE4_9CILI|nr:unnamed protein product [Paramecium sonneborni]